MTTYIYKNQYGVEVNENQIDNMDTYYKVTLISSIEKIVELIEKNEVAHISYNLETSETIASLLPNNCIEPSTKTLLFVIEPTVALLSDAVYEKSDVLNPILSEESEYIIKFPPYPVLLISNPLVFQICLPPVAYVLVWNTNVEILPWIS